MLPDVIGLVIYLFLFLVVLNWDYDKPSKKKSNSDHDPDEEDINEEYDGKDAVNAGKFTGQFGALARKYTKPGSDVYEGNLLFYAQIRSHEKHTESKAILKQRLRDRYEAYLRDGGR